MGAMYQFVNTKNEANLSLANRLFSVAMSVLFVGIAAAYGIDHWQWNAYAISMLGILGGMGADKLLRLILALYNDSTSLVDFFGRISDAAKAAWGAYNSVRAKDKNDDNA
ncbi:hypothetical protein GCM10028807_63150 [Spirosoma daeguense]